MQSRVPALLRITLLFAVFILLLGNGMGQSAAQSTPAATETATQSATAKATSAPTQAATEAGVATEEPIKSVLTLGDVSDKPTATISVLQPIADYLAPRLAKYGVTSIAFKIAPDFKTLQKWLQTGEVDLIFQTPYPAVLLADSIHAKVILRRWKDGDAEYYTVVFGKADSGMKTLADLKGRMLAVQDDYSTSAYMLPLAYAIESGLTVTRKDTPNDSVAANEVGFTYSKSDDNTLQWVISGKVAAGATDFRHYEKIPADTRQQLVVLLETEKVPRGVAMVSPIFNSALTDAIKTILMDMDKTDEGKATLAKFQTTAKFDELPGGADEALARIRTLSKLLNQGK